MLPFFVVGILCCRFGWHKYMSRCFFLLPMAILFFICNIMGFLPEVMKAETAFIGTFFSMSLCLIVGKYTPKLFNSFRDYTFQIFLMGIFFQMVIRWIYVKWSNEMMFVPMWLLSVIIGIYVPTLIAKQIDKYAPKYIKMCFGL